MEKFKCFHCEIGNTYEKKFSLDISRGRKKITVHNLLKTACDNCDYESVSMIQLDHNNLIIEKLSKDSQSVFFPGMLRSIRDKWSLSQRQLSKLFGAGESSVGKWESGASMSTPAALLAQCALHVPGTVEYLAQLAEVELSLPKKNESTFIVEAIAYRRNHSSFIYSSAANTHSYEESYSGTFEKAAA